MNTKEICHKWLELYAGYPDHVCTDLCNYFSAAQLVAYCKFMADELGFEFDTECAV